MKAFALTLLALNFMLALWFAVLARDSEFDSTRHYTPTGKTVELLEPPAMESVQRTVTDLSDAVDPLAQVQGESLNETADLSLATGLAQSGEGSAVTQADEETLLVVAEDQSLPSTVDAPIADIAEVGQTTEEESVTELLPVPENPATDALNVEPQIVPTEAPQEIVSVVETVTQSQVCQWIGPFDSEMQAQTALQLTGLNPEFSSITVQSSVKTGGFQVIYPVVEGNSVDLSARLKALGFDNYPQEGPEGEKELAMGLFSVQGNAEKLLNQLRLASWTEGELRILQREFQNYWIESSANATEVDLKTLQESLRLPVGILQTKEKVCSEVASQSNFH